MHKTLFIEVIVLLALSALRSMLDSATPCVASATGDVTVNG